MKTLVALLACVLITAEVEEAPHAIDTEASEINWTGYHLVKSYEHKGNIKLKSGSLDIDKGKLIGGNFIVDMTSITNSDIEKEKDNQKLVGHLKSPDFFDVVSFPEASFQIKSVDEESDGVYAISGDVTIRGITKEIAF